MIVLNGGTSLITNQTQVVPKTLSSKKIKATSCAGANLGEMVIIMNGIGNNIKHIIKIKILYIPVQIEINILQSMYMMKLSFISIITHKNKQLCNINILHNNSKKRKQELQEQR